MLAEFIKKPVGMMVLLAGAAGGPYVLHETDAGKMVLNTANGWIKSDSTAGSDLQNFGMGSLDPSSLSLPSGTPSTFPMGYPTSTSLPVPGAPNSPFPSTMPTASPSTPAGPIFGMGANPSLPSSPVPMGQSFPATVPMGLPVSTSYLGPARPIPGGTPELWNYTTGVPTLPQLQQSSTSQPITGGPVRDLRDVIRFDINPAWVMQNFGRVTTVLADVKLDGLRVPLVTGTAPTDLAGTITYYFDNQQTLRRINLQGLTGNPANLANLMQQYYNLKPEKSLGGHLFTTRWNNQITSMLHIAPAPIVYATAQNSNFTLFLELNQPSMPYGLSTEAQQILSTGHQTSRW